MKRQTTLALAAALTLVFSSLSLGAQKAKKPQKKTAKRTAVGTIDRANVKAKTIRVAPTAPSQQLQTQNDIQGQKPKAKKPRFLVFHIDKNTEIASRTGRQDKAKGKPAGDDLEAQFKLLKPGLLVRVVYTQEQRAADSGQQQAGQEQKDKDKGKEKESPQQADQKQKQKQNGAEQQDEDGKKGSAEQKKKPGAKRILRAVSVEILGESPQQQQPMGQQKPAK